MQLFTTRTRTEYRLRCYAVWDHDGSGCWETGRWGCSESEAIELAEEDGWKVIDGTWACPAHVRGKEQVETAKGEA